MLLGHRVRVYLRDPDKSVDGDLRRQTVEGVWLYHRFQEQAAVHFYPQHRITEIADLGESPR